MKRKIQSVSHGIVTHKSKVLVYRVEDKLTKKSFFRLIGGHIEFGESASDALVREFKEEINENIQIVRNLSIFENIFFYNGKKQHEFVALFEIKFLNKDLYNKQLIIGSEGPHRTYNARWVPINDFKNNSKILYPPEILEYL